MTPAQQTALEGLIGRPLTAGEISSLDPLLSNRNDVSIAAILSVGRFRTQPTPIGIGTVLAVMAPSGGDFLNALESMGAADSNVKWALKMIEQGTFDVGHPVTRAQLQAFAGQSRRCQRQSPLWLWPNRLILSKSGRCQTPSTSLKDG